MKQAFLNSKTVLAKAAMLVHPCTDFPLALTSDASDVAVGAVLVQFNKGHWQATFSLFQLTTTKSRNKIQCFRPRITSSTRTFLCTWEKILTHKHWYCRTFNFFFWLHISPDNYRPQHTLARSYSTTRHYNTRVSVCSLDCSFRCPWRYFARARVTVHIIVMEWDSGSPCSQASPYICLSSSGKWDDQTF